MLEEYFAEEWALYIHMKKKIIFKTLMLDISYDLIFFEKIEFKESDVYYNVLCR